jgi:hypothetical protein
VEIRAGRADFEQPLVAAPPFAVTAVTALMAIVPVTLFLLRLIVYWVPDLVNLAPQIDDKFSEKLKTHSDEASDGNGRRVDLSFIGHSMGGFVVTKAVRILSDVFSPEAIAALL